MDKDLDKLAIAGLHRHWIYADAIKDKIDRSHNAPVISETNLPPALEAAASMFSTFSALSVWYALLYVVVEGYQELDIKHQKMDELLSENEKVSALRLFRNAIFHVQSKPINEKLLGFLEATDSEYWINELNTAMKDFFETELDIKKMLTDYRVPKTPE